ncbi:hypothetical protein I545_5848 [Mycobacterium kansasii 662]|uniref:Uncharacterized protein n=1 Tax=Mycobacterium kansasii 662 TaxID=1299326 RepID=X7YSD3_MYCKA|nr:hypothetical protein I545_5848 [Mycobacterium kansasii 662]
MDPIEMMKCCEMIVGAMMDDPCYPPPPPPPGCERIHAYRCLEDEFERQGSTFHDIHRCQTGAAR